MDKDAASKTASQAAVLAMQAADKAAQLDEQYKIQEKASGLAAYSLQRANSLANKAAAKAGEINEQYKLRDKASDALNQAGAAASRAAAQVAGKLDQAKASNAQPVDDMQNRRAIEETPAIESKDVDCQCAA